MILAMVIMVIKEVDCSKQLATRNANMVWYSLVPLYLLALGLLYLFYERCHVWKKEGVSVGFQFETNPKEELLNPNIERNIAERKFRGLWVTETSRGESKTNLERVSIKLNVTPF